jgi:hypothetical protein
MKTLKWMLAALTLALVLGMGSNAYAWGGGYCYPRPYCGPYYGYYSTPYYGYYPAPYYGYYSTPYYNGYSPNYYGWGYRPRWHHRHHGFFGFRFGY